MELTWSDELGRKWSVDAYVSERTSRLGGADAVLTFSREGSAERRIEVLGPLRAALEDPDDTALQHALDAAGAAVGVLLVDEEGGMWWVRGPESEPFQRSWALKFSDGRVELVHEGPLPDELDALGEDQLRELLDEVRGRIMDPMDVTGGEEDS